MKVIPKNTNKITVNSNVNKNVNKNSAKPGTTKSFIKLDSVPKNYSSKITNTSFNQVNSTENIAEQSDCALCDKQDELKQYVKDHPTLIGVLENFLKFKDQNNEDQNNQTDEKYKDDKYKLENIVTLPLDKAEDMLAILKNYLDKTPTFLEILKNAVQDTLGESNQAQNTAKTNPSTTNSSASTNKINISIPVYKAPVQSNPQPVTTTQPNLIETLKNYLMQSAWGRLLLDLAEKLGIPISITNDLPDTVTGVTNYNPTEIEIAPGTTEDMVETLAHELVHGVTAGDGNSLQEEIYATVVAETISTEVGLNDHVRTMGDIEKWANNAPLYKVLPDDNDIVEDLENLGIDV